MDPKVISLDIETYGKWSRMPDQTCFSPPRSVVVDGVPAKDLVLTCAITLPQTDPRTTFPSAPSAKDAHQTTQQSVSNLITFASTPSATPACGIYKEAFGSWNAQNLASLKPGPTMVLGLRQKDPAGDYHKLIGWLDHADTLIGMNIQFDLLYLRASRPALREILVPFRHTLIDLSVVNFLEFEGRPERSLKNLGPVLGAYTYRDADLARLSRMQDIRSYNAQDTHNTLVAVSILARRILRTFGDTSPKLSAECIQFYSDTIWSCILMTEAGVPFKRSALEALRTRYLDYVQRVEALLATRYGLLLSGKGSNESKQSFLSAAIDLADYLNPVSPVRADPQFQVTPAKKEASFSDVNRSLIAERLPPGHPYQRALRLIDTYTLRQKVLSTYLWPLLDHARKNDQKRSSVLVPTRGVLPWKKSQTAPTFASSSQSLKKPFTGNTHPSTATPDAPCSPSTSLSGSTIPVMSSSPATTPRAMPSRTSPLKGSREDSPTTLSSGPRFPQGPASPFNSDVWLSHASWFIVPSRFKDDTGSAGGTIQARLTCKDGAHQTDPPTIQACRASRWADGHLVSYDASQIELRVPAVLSGEPSMVEEYLKSKPDLHTAMTVALFGPDIVKDPHFKKGGPDDPRQYGKTANFLILFRGGPDKLQSSLLELTGKVQSLGLCQEVVRKANAARPVLRAWQDTLIKEAETLGYLQLPITGQSRTFAGGDKYEVNEIVNYPVQSHAANVVRDVMHNIAKSVARNPDILMYLNVYDALYFDCRNQAAVTTLDSLFKQAVSTCQDTGYWAQLCTLSGHRIPLVFERKAA